MPDVLLHLVETSSEDIARVVIKTMKYTDQLLSRLDRAYDNYRLPRIQRLLKYPIATLWRSTAWKFADHVLGQRHQARFTTTLFFGAKLQVPVPPCQELWLYGLYLDKAEINLTKFLILNLGKGDTFFDVGANVGFYSLLGAELTGKEGKVYAFEPCPTVFPLLQTNVAAHQQVEIVRKALGAAEGSIEFFIAPGEHMVSSSTSREHIIETGIADQSQSVSVDCSTLDAFCFSNNVFPKIIKLDVEGTEAEVLKGGEKFLTEHSPIVIMEASFTKSSDKTEEALLILRRYGYSPFIIGETGDVTPMSAKTVAEFGETIRQDPLFIHGLDNIVFCKNAAC